ncbi:hypothetical protein PAHAL_3G489800 [Panicum hallii]|uniref:Uncharacterized protein n=1 Tax=Panicum hallii TaxID=206008 RepID=A0A2T8KM23_9POAL|nr:hypothetical protein PAHAL_3G489800 [Panicum hallii]
MIQASTHAPVTHCMIDGPLEDSWATQLASTSTRMNAKLQALLYGDLVGRPVCYKMPAALSFPAVLLSVSLLQPVRMCVCFSAAFRARGR